MMTRRASAKIAAVLCLGLSASPAVAQETTSGGAEATVDRPELVVRPGALLERTLSIRGRTEAGDAGRPVRIEVQNPDGSWRQIASTTVAPDATLAAAWRTDTTGRLTLRAIVERPDDAAVAASAPLVAQTTVFRPAVASWYGPGFFGRRTACGTRLTRKTLGVAHKTLPCGTQVDLYHAGRTITVPVIDRGPFVAGREWDLTQATAEAIGVRSTVRIGALAPEPTAYKRKSRR
jgi:rare lipoprotein A